MAKELHCGDIMEGCAHVVRGDTEEEVLEKGARHADEVHGISELDEETLQKVKSAIRTV